MPRRRIRLINASAARLLGATEDDHRHALARRRFAALADYMRAGAPTDASPHHGVHAGTGDNNLRITAHLAPLGKRRTQRPGARLPRGCERDERARAAVQAGLARTTEREYCPRNPQPGRRDESCRTAACASRRNDHDDKRLTEIIQTHSKRVSHIIDNVLQLSRRESSGRSGWSSNHGSKTSRRSSRARWNCRKANSRSHRLRRNSRCAWIRATCGR